MVRRPRHQRVALARHLVQELVVVVVRDRALDREGDAVEEAAVRIAGRTMSYPIPNVITANPRGDRIMGVYSHLLTQRILALGTALAAEPGGLRPGLEDPHRHPGDQ